MHHEREPRPLGDVITRVRDNGALGADEREQIRPDDRGCDNEGFC